MRAALGTAALAAGTAACVLGILSLALGIARHDDRFLHLGRRFVFALLAAALLGVGTMEWALFAHDFSIDYVANNVARATPGLFTFTALWGSLDGSILLWALVLAGYLAVTAHRFRARATDPLVAWATLTGLGVALFFFVLMLGPANPFQLLSGAVPADGRGPNPLLQNHPLMAFHPPMLYLGYVGFTIPFAFAVGALATGRFGEGWLADVRRSTLVAWLFLTGGIVLGAWWSYEVLGWGGYWGWDPVENASLLPWLTGTAFLHSVMVQERRAMLRVWNLSLVIATFCLTILGTFLTRSGIVSSVHAFSQSGIGPAFLTFLGLVAAVGVGLIAWRGDKLRAPGRIDSPLSREAAFLANNLVFAAFAFVVLLGTVYPILVEALQDRQVSVGEPYFERMTVPLGLTLLFLMAVAPLLPWRAAGAETLRRRLLAPAWIGVATMAVTLVAGARGVAPVIAFGLAAFAVSGVVRQVHAGLRARRAAGERSWFRATGALVRGNPRLYGGLVVHVGVVVIAVALAMSGHVTKREVRLDRGKSAEVAGYTLTFRGMQTTKTGQKTTIKANVAIARGGDHLGVYAPAISTFPNANSGIGTPSVRTGLLRDVYLTLVSSPADDGRITLAVAVNPLVLWIWVGGTVIGAGTLVALTPARRRDVRAAAGAPVAASILGPDDSGEPAEVPVP